MLRRGRPPQTPPPDKWQGKGTPHTVGDDTLLGASNSSRPYEEPGENTPKECQGRSATGRGRQQRLSAGTRPS
ncbi:putative multicopper oxidase [Streptomyces lydicamycinicus]|uniref:Putative multicopper oxidase n=1 Tax=Streptomyces lydicamycinicus TaxID=1546107 RepID=A0A0P4R8X8_9ACTN|nr:putative multicopper oxidase [Streptomyces lydicamycinicus]